jgi:hypothetical protein
MSGKARLAVTAVCVFIVTAAMLVGAAGRGAADTTPTACPGNGKSICVSISDQARASITTDAANNPHYLTDHVTISNGGTTANLVNMTLTITWADTGAAATTSEYVQSASDQRCAPTPNTSLSLTCATPKSLGPQQFETFGPLIFRTATTTAATDTHLTAVATAKEQGVAKQGKNPPTATVTSDPNPTPYEVSIDDDVSWAGGGLSVTLATSSTVGKQFSKLPLPSGMLAGFATLTETDCPATSTTATCKGQQVSTVATGLSPVNLQITYVGDLPGGVQESDIVVLHTRSGAPAPTAITTACSGALFSGQPADSEIPCRRVKITRGVAPGGIARVEIDAWDVSNGDWTWR